MSRGLRQGGKATWTRKSRDMAEHPQHRHAEAWTGCGEGGWRPRRLAPVGIALATPCRHVISTDATTLGAQRALVASEQLAGRWAGLGNPPLPGPQEHLLTSSLGAPGQGLLAEFTGQAPSRLQHNGAPEPPCCSQLSKPEPVFLMPHQCS